MLFDIVNVTIFQWLSTIIRYAGASQRQGDLFQDGNIFSKGKNVLKKGLKGVENIYTQHVPLIARTLEDLTRGSSKPRDALFPYAETTNLKYVAFVASFLFIPSFSDPPLFFAV